MGMKSACFLSFTPFPLSFTAVQAPNSQNKMRDHRNYKDRNAENASYIHAQRDAVKPVPLNVPSYSRPMNSSYIKGNVNKEPKPNSVLVRFITYIIYSCLQFASPWNFWMVQLTFTVTQLLFFLEAITTITSQKTSGGISSMCRNTHDLKDMEENMLGDIICCEPPQSFVSEHSTLFPLDSFTSLLKIVFKWLTLSCSTNYTVQ